MTLSGEAVSEAVVDVDKDNITGNIVVVECVSRRTHPVQRHVGSSCCVRGAHSSAVGRAIAPGSAPRILPRLGQPPEIEHEVEHVALFLECS